MVMPPKHQCPIIKLELADRCTKPTRILNVRIKSLVLIGGPFHFHRSKACTLLQVKQMVPHYQNVAPKVAHISTIVPFKLTSKN
jgi:hypothetical protein